MSVPTYLTDDFIQNRYKDFSFVIFKRQVIDTSKLRSFLKKDDTRFSKREELQGKEDFSIRNNKTNPSKICSIL